MHDVPHEIQGWGKRSGAASVASALFAALLAACGGGEPARTEDTSTAAAGAPAATAPAAGVAVGGASATGAANSPQAIALGDSIFHGLAAGGICMTCHGPGAKGGQLAPDLTDQQWLNGDGSYDFIVQVISNGVPEPKQHPAPMPGFGQTFTPDQVRAVAAYVYSLSRRGS